jgi:hypothetical protein
MKYSSQSGRSFFVFFMLIIIAYRLIG